MYESERKISIRGIIVAVLLIVLIICLLLWIFSVRKNNNSNTKEITYSEKMNTNIKVLENAGRAYYYKAALPTKINDSKKTTLKDLIKNKMITTLYDKEGKECDSNLSYVSLTKKSNDEFDLKSHLKCGNEEKEIISSLYCKDTKGKCEVKKSTQSVTKNNTKNDVYEYQYSCKENHNIYSDWSNWSTNYVSSSDTLEVQTKVVKETKYVKTGTKEEPTTTYVKKKVNETTYEEQKWVDTKPDNAKSCYTMPKNGYTIYVCQVPVTKVVEKEEPVTTYNTVDVYDYEDVDTTYYRYRSVDKKTNSFTYWTTTYDDESLLAAGCSIIASRKISK